MALPTTKPSTEHKYLRLADMRGLRHLYFSRRRPVDGRYAGRHATAMRGHSVEFSDYREYIPGDELADVDWKVYGRSDRLYIKIFEHESDMTVHLLIDASASMGYRGMGPTHTQSKYDLACRVAAAVAFLTIKQQDRVSLGFAQGGLQGQGPALGAFPHLVSLLASMETRSPIGEARLAETLKDLAGRVGRRGLLIVLSDLLEDREEIMKSLSIFTHRGGEAILFHTLHEDELTLPDLDEAVFTDSESGARVRLNVADVRTRYQEAMREFTDSWRGAASSRAIDYRVVSTATDYRKALEHYLFSRATLR